MFRNGLDIFGKGASVELATQYKLSKNFGLSFDIGYKTKGYILGKQIKKGINLGIGFIYHTK